MSPATRIQRVLGFCDPTPKAILIESGPRGESDLSFFYLTGFEQGSLYGSSVVAARGERPKLITSTMEADRAAGMAGMDIIKARKRSEMDTAIIEALGSRCSVGYSPHGITAGRLQTLTRLLPSVTWIDVSKALARASCQR